MICLNLRDFSCDKLTLKMADELKARLAAGKFIPGDILSYTISSERYQNVLVRYDRKMIEVLARSGDEEALETLDNITRWERAHSLKPLPKKKGFFRNSKIS